MDTEGKSYNAKLEKQYFYLPKICRKSSNSTKSLFNDSNVRIS